MTVTWTLSPWVEQRRERITFALQVFPIDTPGAPAPRLLATGRLAAALGFEAFFSGDHPAWGLDGWLHLAALAVTTQRIGLGSNVNCIYYRHPVLLARLAADLDNLSSGRLILGVGTGWDANEFANFGLPFPPAAERAAALEEALTIIRGVWGADPFTFRGRTFQTTGGHVAPPPVRPPPLIIAGGGERITLRQVAAFADACNLTSFGQVNGAPTPADIQRKLAVLRAHCADLGRPYDHILRTHLTGWLILAPDAPALQAKLQGYFPAGLAARFSGERDGFVFAGTPAQAVSYYRELAAAGVQYFVVETLDAADEETIRLLADVVVPAVG
jgi:alkanesulfonate monooxygenase SsuD/methylene tetrahydromethanopterin reductase-like flavin-dependent oxidoreductase (luciferase family)